MTTTPERGVEEIPNIEDFKKAIDEGVMVDEHGFIYIKKAELFRLMDKCTHHQLQKAREEERGRIVKVVEKEAAEVYVEMLGAVIDQQGLKVQDYAVMNTAMIQHILTGTIGNLSARIYKATQAELDQDKK